jgi:cytochrome b pre-mRNA-processing protein 3
MVFSFFRRTPPAHEVAADALYVAVCEAARAPGLYAAGLMPDTVGGRFESVCLHTHLVLRQLSAVKADEKLSQRLFDTLFADMDQSLRELGTSDVVIGKEIRKLAQGFYGRAEAYEHGLREGATDDLLCAAISRNLLAGQEAPLADAARRLAAYSRRQADHLAAVPSADLIAGRLRFAAVTP